MQAYLGKIIGGLDAVAFESQSKLVLFDACISRLLLVTVSN